MSKSKPILAIYKVVRSFKHKTLGRIKVGRFVTCTALYAKNHTIRHELIRCKADKQESAIKDSLWIDVIDDLRKKKPEPKPEPKPETKQKPKSKNGKQKNTIR